ncbi:MAG TPA: hypothetical protein VIJ79_10635 [Acidobacteriaceae bacterium]
MSRRILLLLFPLFFVAATVSAHAQIGGDAEEFVWQDSQTIHQTPPPSWAADMRPNPRYPITIRLAIEHRQFDGQKFVGGGTGHIFNPTSENIDFKFRCGVTFPPYRSVEFYGRWITPGRKLEIRLRDPHSKRTQSCRIRTSLPPAVP